MKSKITKITSLLLVISLVVITLISGVASASGFPDLNPMHWCYEKIMDFLDKEYICGYEDGTFRADKVITRAEYVKIVNNFFGYSESENINDLNFSDVSEEDWFAKQVATAVEKGYITGYPDGSFKPHNPIRRQEATVILSRILGIDDEVYPEDHKDGMAQYTDGKEIEEWAYTAVHSYSVYNFINGYTDGSIKILQNVTRAETVELLNRLEEKIVIDREDPKPTPGGGTSYRYVSYYNDGKEIQDYKTKVVKGKTAVVRPAIEKEHYEFAGWNVRGTDTIYQPATSTEKITSNLILDAIWNLKNYNMNYTSISGDNIPEKDTVKAFENYTISEKVPVREGYSFAGWRESGDTEIYVAKDGIENVIRDYNFEALWTNLEISVDPEDGTVPSGDGIAYELTSDNLTMYVGEIGKLDAKLNPEYSNTTYNYEVISSTNNENISLAGDIVTALKKTETPVQVKVTATTAEGIVIEKVINVTVLDREITVTTPDEESEEGNAIIGAEGITIRVGETGELTATITPDSKEKSYEWKTASGNIEITGTSSERTTVKGLAVGETFVIVEIEIGGQVISKEVKVTVEAIPVVINHRFPKGKNDVTGYGPDNLEIDDINDSITVMDYKYSGDKATWYDATSDVAEITCNSESFEANITYTRHNTTYTVEHYKEDLNADTYTLVEADTEIKNGVAGEMTEAVAKTTYSGFTPNTVEQVTILR